MNIGSEASEEHIKIPSESVSPHRINCCLFEHTLMPWPSKPIAKSKGKIKCDFFEEFHPLNTV